MSFIQPLQLETWMIQVFAGDPEVFTAVALMVIASLAGFFRMNGISMFFMIGVFLIMFSGFINSPLLTFIAVIGGLLLGYTLSKIFVQR